MKTIEETQTPSTPVEPEFEWGVQFRSCWSGDLEVVWGYSVDPRTNGVIDEEGDIQLRSYYHHVVAVGKRLKAPEVWETV